MEDMAFSLCHAKWIALGMRLRTWPMTDCESIDCAADNGCPDGVAAVVGWNSTARHERGQAEAMPRREPSGSRTYSESPYKQGIETGGLGTDKSFLTE